MKDISEQRRRKCHLPEYAIDNVAKEIRVKVYACDYTDAENSFMTSGKDGNVIKEHQETIMKESFMTSGKDENVTKESFMTSEKSKDVTKKISKIQDLMIIAIRKDPSITTAELSDLTGMTTRTVARNLKKLQELNILERIGGRKNGYWDVK